MLDRVAHGELPAKHHTVLRSAEGELRHEECLTREGFDGPYSLLYHAHRPHTHAPVATKHRAPTFVEAPADGLKKRHFRLPSLPAAAGPALDARVPLLWNDDVAITFVRPTEPDPAYLTNADGDDLYFIWQGAGLLRSSFGDVRFEANDYVCVPKGVLHRFIPDAGVEQAWFHVECRGGLHLPRQWRTATGQLRMDAPFCHRDFRRPEFRGPVDEGIRTIVAKRASTYHGFEVETSPLDVVGWDGSVYPWVFPIVNFQPRAGLVHLPPDWHGTFATRGALICSFVPRVVDFHPEAIPCPYPHSSVDCDEILFYVSGNFTSRRGVGPGSVSLHPTGIPHGPHPGAYEAGIGTARTDDLAVMLDSHRPLRWTREA
ncbi:MAG: homogentisate 1,2-dioxygenase, partial [Myxococcales bacterium]|nr:homogentisate 1,2-dioxygenase [Myxococcales bacterium]